MGIYFNEAKTLDEKKHMANEQVGKKVKRLRTAKKLTQKEFAIKYKIRGGNSGISKIERGQRSIKAEMLPILAEDGNTTVEQFFREDVTVARNVIYNCLSNMNIDGNHIEPIMKYVDSVSKAAIENVGYTKLFDLLFTVLRTASIQGDHRGMMIDQINIVELDNYENKNSRYINFLKEVAIYNGDDNSDY